GIANIDSSYTATHVDVRASGKWFGDETVTTAYSVCSDFYGYFGLSRTDVYGKKIYDITNRDDVKDLQNALNSKGYNCGSVDGIIGNNTIRAMFDAVCELVI
ncbi:MAG: peptidoglycan-binding protein, partial [Alistipes sp.]|nr:peptidoglycan-binding protein [Alistipes sp.]